MIVAEENGAYGTLRDATGAFIPYCLRADTWTGWAECYRTDAEGHITGEHVRRRYLPPLAFEPAARGAGVPVPGMKEWAVPLEEYPA